MRLKTKIVTLLTVTALGAAFQSHAMGSRVPEDTTVNEETLKGKWQDLKGTVQEEWGRLTDKDMSEINGDLKRLYEKIQEYYGESKEAVNEKLNRLMGKFNNK